MPRSTKRSKPRPKRRRIRRRLKVPRRRSKNRSPLVFFLSLVILVETLLLLFLIPKTLPPKESLPSYKKEVQIQKGKVSPKRPVSVAKARKLRKKALAKIAPIVKKRRGKIAIVIDDWGYNNRNLILLKEIKSPLTVAILPFRDYSRRIAEFAHKNNFEIIIHMPMEPKDKEILGLEPKTLMTYMGASTIDSIMGGAIDDIPYAKGINNHMGSRATESEKFITNVFKHLKKADFYFLDSYVTPDSVCDRVSKKIGVRFARRSIFLDNHSQPEYIEGQLMKLAQESDKNGYAIGIGHDRASTLKVLKKKIRELEDQGYRFVFLSELVK